MVSFRVRRKALLVITNAFPALVAAVLRVLGRHAYSYNQLILRNTGDKIPFWFGLLLEPDLRFVAL